MSLRRMKGDLREIIRERQRNDEREKGWALVILESPSMTGKTLESDDQGEINTTKYRATI